MKLVTTSLFLTAVIAFVGAQQNGDIRLEDGGDSLTRGRLEVFLGNDWGTICFDRTRPQEGVAQAACRQLGYNDFREVNTVEQMNIPASGNDTDTLLFGMHCSLKSNLLNAVQHILRCSYATGPPPCPLSDQMAIECEDEARNSYPYDTMVAIMDEDISPFSSVSSGYAQVYLHGDWGPVCNMEMEDANSFCRQLSYTGAVDVQDTDTTMDTKEVLDSFKCKDSQPCLRRCFSYPKKDKAIDCQSRYSFVTCTFDTDQYDNVYGTKSVCNYMVSNSAVVAGAVVGSLLAFVVVVAVVVIACFCVPGFPCYKRKINVYKPVTTSSGPKYDSL